MDSSAFEGDELPTGGVDTTSSRHRLRAALARPAETLPGWQRLTDRADALSARSGDLAARAADVAHRRWFAHWLPLTMLALATLYWTWAFVGLVVDQHRNYGTWDFDLGIFDQATWLLSRGDSFISVRGLPFLGHHLNFGLYLYVPLYWLGAGAETLQASMVIALAVGVVPLALICRHYRPEHSWYSLALSITFLYSAVPQDLLAESFHPGVMAVPGMLGAIWAALGRRWRIYAACLVFVLCWREDLPLFTFMLGAAVAWKRDRRVGVITMGLSLLYFAVGSQVLGHYAGGAPFYAGVLGPIGDTPTEVAVALVREPSLLTNAYNNNDGAGYFTRIQAPWAFASLLSPSSLLLALPVYLINVLSVQGYTHLLSFHYVAVPYVATAFSATRGLHSRKDPRVRAGLAVAMVAITVWTHNGGTGPWSRRHDEGVWQLYHTEQMELMDEAIDLVPPDGSVSATYRLVPHLTHRQAVYTFPNPWIPRNWGIGDQNPPWPEEVEWVLVDLDSLGEPDTYGFELLRDNDCFTAVYDQHPIVLLQRVDTGCWTRQR